MSQVGQRERQTQNRIVQLFQQLGYHYLGNWSDRPNNSNIETEILTTFLHDKQGYSDSLITKALYELNKVAGDQSKSLYDINKEVYSLLRYGVKVKAEAGENTQTVWLINWEEALENNFAIAEEVTVKGENTKRPDIVLYVNGIALGVLELKRSTISVSQGIRQNLDNQKSIFIKSFFTTMQFVMAGNDTEGRRYATTETPEKYYLTWKEKSHSDIKNLLDRHLLKLFEKQRFLELIHNFIVFDSGIKKLCRHNQYFGVKAAQSNISRREGGIIWHTQGSGKSLTMVWLAKWIREYNPHARVLIITDCDELDEQIKNVFLGVNENIYRTTSGRDLITQLKLIIDQQPTNPKYFENMSALLDELIQLRKTATQDYQAYLQQIVELSKQVVQPSSSSQYPQSLNSAAKRALYDNLERDEALALRIDEAISQTKKDSWQGNKIKEREVKNAIKQHLDSPEDCDSEALLRSADRIFEIVKSQSEY